LLLNGPIRPPPEIRTLKLACSEKQASSMSLCHSAASRRLMRCDSITHGFLFFFKIYTHASTSIPMTFSALRTTPANRYIDCTFLDIRIRPSPAQFVKKSFPSILSRNLTQVLRFKAS
jgi:hypothetical protein